MTLADTPRNESQSGEAFDLDTYLDCLGNLHKTFHTSWSPTPTPCPDTSHVGDNDSLPKIDETAINPGDPYDIFNLLKPAEPSGYNPVRACMESTREAILNRVITWSQNNESSESLMWISGQAGMGKTSVATSLCQRLDKMGALAGSFFCQQNCPNFSDPLRLINTLVYEIASRCPLYAHEVANAIRANRIVCISHLSIRYEGLVKIPLERLKSLSVPQRLVVIVDALDECGDWDSQRMVLNMLYDMSQLVEWIKVVFTARPEGHLIEDFLNRYSREPIIRLQTYDAADDIRAYTQSQLGPLARKEQWPNASITRLCEMAQGVFLWAALTTKYIKNSTTPASSRLHQVLENRKSPVTDHFDALYTKVLMGAMNDYNEDTKTAYTRCIGAILATSEHHPLAVLDLQRLLEIDSQIGPGTLERVLASLGPLVLMIGDQHVKFHHPSFRDYITDSSRAQDFHILLERYEAKLANYCLAIMQRDLRFNICKLETSYLRNSEVADLKSRAHLHIGSPLKYACMHWTDHFTISPNQELVEAVRKFLDGPQFIYWMEVLSLLGRLDAAKACLSELMSPKLIRFDGGRLIISWAEDAHRLLLSFYNAIAESTPHLYVSTLAFSPSKSLTARRMRPYFPNTIVVAQGGDTTWHPCINAILHPHAVQCLSTSSDGLRFIAGYSDGSLGLWDLQTGTRISESIVGHTDSVTCAVFSSCGKLVASSSFDATVRVWDVTGIIRSSHVLSGHYSSVLAVSISPNSGIIASGSSDKMIRLWDLENMSPIGDPCIGHSGGVSSVVFSPDGTKLVSGSWDKTIRVWSVNHGGRELASEPLVITGHSGLITCVSISPDGSKIASGSADKTIRIWDAQTGSKIESCNPPAKQTNAITSISFSPNGSFITSSSSDGAVYLRDVATLEPIVHPFGHTDAVNSVSFASGGACVLSGSTDKTTRLWEINKCPKLMTPGPLIGHSSFVYSVSISADGTRIVSGACDNTVRMWDAQTGSPIGDPYLGHSGSVDCVAISPDGNSILSGSHDKSLKLWDTTTQAIIHSYQYDSHIPCAAFSPDGALIAFGSWDGKVYLFKSTAWEMVGDSLQGHSGPALSVSFSPDGACLASASGDYTIILWDVHGRSRLGEPLSGHTSYIRSVAFSPHGSQFVSGSDDQTVRLWARNTGTAILKLTGHSASVHSVAFSPDGSLIGSGSLDKTVRLWNSKSGQAIGQLSAGYNCYVRSIAFSPDGNYVVFGSDDKTIRVWNIDSSKPTEVSGDAPPGTYRWPENPYELSFHPQYPGWVALGQRSLAFWLPEHYRQPTQFLRTSTQAPCPYPSLALDYSKFVHGTAWISVTNKS